MKKFLKYTTITILAILLLGTGGFVIWASNPLGPDQVALDAMQSDSMVEVSEGDWLVFDPIGESSDIGVIYYPGGRVDYRSYAPFAHKLAAEGYKTIIVPMPLSMAFFAPTRADEVIADFPEIENWVIGGHSLGGAMAANYVYSNPDAMEGLILWASFPAGFNDLSDSDIPVASIYGSLDMGVDGILGSFELLPEDAFIYEIEGANHAQFGWYGPQPGDNEPQIGHVEQEEEILSATVEFLESIENEIQ